MHAIGVDGSRDADFAAFVEARYGSLVRTARLLAGSTGHAEDLVQEALLRTYRSWRRIKRAEAAESYTRTTMMRLFVKDRRRRWSQEIPAADLPDVVEADAGEDIALGMAVRDVLNRLPSAQRAVLILRYYHELTEREIAETLGCSPGTVKSRAARALSTLRAEEALRDIAERGRNAADE